MTSGITFQDVAHDALRHCDQIRFRVEGRSMHPFVHQGDIVTVRKIQPDGLRRGDVILATIPGGHTVLHRLVALDREARTMTLRGDASCVSSETIPTSELMGKAVSAERTGRLRRLDSPSARILAAVWLASAPVRRVARALTARLPSR